MASQMTYDAHIEQLLVKINEFLDLLQHEEMFIPLTMPERQQLQTLLIQNMLQLHHLAAQCHAMAVNYDEDADAGENNDN